MCYKCMSMKSERYLILVIGTGKLLLILTEPGIRFSTSKLTMTSNNPVDDLKDQFDIVQATTTFISSHNCR